MKILVPVDFSKNALNALTFACHIALEKNASVALLNVFSAPLVNESTISGELVSELIHEQNEMSASRLQKLADQVKFKNPEFKDIYFSYRVILGFAADVILDYADENEMNLIVMGLRGATSAIERALGSVAGKVIARSEIPVLGIPEDCSYHSIRSIGYATDFHKLDANCFARARGIFGELVNYEFIHIHDEDEISDSEFAKRKEVKSLRNELEELGVNNVKFTAHRYPNFVGGIEEVIKHDGIDLLVLLHQKRGVFGLFKGSETKEAAYSLNKPVLVFHE